MKRIPRVLLNTTLILSFVFVSLSFAGEPYAHLHKFQDKEFRGAFGMTIEEAKDMELWPPVKDRDVPKKTAIAAPLYPGAEIVSFRGPHKTREGGKFIFQDKK